MSVNKIVPQHLCMHNCTPFGPRDRGRLGALIRLPKERARKQLNFVKSKGGGGGGGGQGGRGECRLGWGEWCPQRQHCPMSSTQVGSRGASSDYGPDKKVI